MVACRFGVRTWLHPLLRECLRGSRGNLQRLTRLNVLMGMLTGMFSSPAWPETMTIVLVGPRIDTTNNLLFRYSNADLIIPLVPWLTISAIREAILIDVGTGPAFFSNYKFAGRDFGGPVQVVGTVGAGFNVSPGFFIEYRLQHFSDASAFGPYKVGVDMHLLEINFRF
jgi:hypothetical protein